MILAYFFSVHIWSFSKLIDLLHFPLFIQFLHYLSFVFGCVHNFLKSKKRNSYDCELSWVESIVSRCVFLHFFFKPYTHMRSFRFSEAQLFVTHAWYEYRMCALSIGHRTPSTGHWVLLKTWNAIRRKWILEWFWSLIICHFSIFTFDCWNTLPFCFLHGRLKHMWAPCTYQTYTRFLLQVFSIPGRCIRWSEMKWPKRLYYGYHYVILVLALIYIVQ